MGHPVGAAPSGPLRWWGLEVCHGLKGLQGIVFVYLVITISCESGRKDEEGEACRNRWEERQRRGRSMTEERLRCERCRGERERFKMFIKGKHYSRERLMYTF